jgi:methylmalonyl-CoA/ethylmalonyl-CoA epimerase
MTEIVENTRQKVRVVFMEKQESTLIKLIEPLNGNKSLMSFVKRGGGFHHLCFKCPNVRDTVAELRSKGLITLVTPQPGEAFNEGEIAFMLARYGTSIELIDAGKKAGMIINNYTGRY